MPDSSAASPSQRYRTIVADPPWCYRNKKALKSGAALQYPVMPKSVVIEAVV